MCTFFRGATLALLAVFVASSCSSASGPADASHSSTTTAPGTSVVIVPPESSPQSSPQDALTQLLRTEMHNDHKGSFRLVLHGADQPYPTEARWSRHRQALPAITGFTVHAGPTSDEAFAVVDHTPGLDPFVGLSPAHDHQTWKATRAGSGWLLYENPHISPDLPPDAGAVQAASTWVATVQRCDRNAARQLQVVTTLFDSTTTTPALCHAAGAVKAGGIGALSPGPGSGDIVAQYTTDALQWARVVQIEAPQRFAVVLAPIGTMWEVLGLTDHS